MAVGEAEVGHALAVVAGVDPLDERVELADAVPHHGQFAGVTDLVEPPELAEQRAAAV
jgi:hypothetical protein